MPVIISSRGNKRSNSYEKAYRFFNGNAPYVVEVGEHLDSLRLKYPDHTEADLPIQSHIYPGRDIMEECFFVSDREVNGRDVHQAIEDLL